MSTTILEAINGNRSKAVLEKENTQLRRLMAQALRIVFNAGDQLSALVGSTLVSAGPTNDYQAVTFAGEDVSVVVNPFTETVTVHDPAGNIPSTEFTAAGGRLSLDQQTTLMGVVARIRTAKTSRVDPVVAVMQLGGEVVAP